MGWEAQCTIQFGKTKSRGKTYFEEKEILFRSAVRGEFRLVIPLAQVKSAKASNGTLTVKYSGGTAALAIGEAAEKWAHKIKKPRGLLDKLGVKPESRVAVVNLEDVSFLDQLHARCRNSAAAEGRQIGQSLGRSKDRPLQFDFLFFRITVKDELHRLKEMQKQIHPAGAIWVVWLKGRKELREDDVRAAAIACGLVDVKVVSFSESLSALKLMIPRDRR